MQLAAAVVAEENEISTLQPLQAGKGYLDALPFSLCQCCLSSESMRICRPSSNARPRKQAASISARATDQPMMEQVSSQSHLCLKTGEPCLLLHFALQALFQQVQPMQSGTFEAYDPRQQEADRAEINQLARMMPDPQEDELFDDGVLSTTSQP